MDKKNLTIGVTLLIAAFVSLYLGNRFAPPPPPAAKPALAAAPAGAASASSAPAPAGTTTAPAPVVNATHAAFSAAAADSATAVVTTLANSFVEVRFTNFGGAPRDIALRKYPAERDRAEPYVFNALHADPLLAFTDFPGLDRHTAFALVAQTARSVTYEAVLDGRLKVTRTYTLAPDAGAETDPYQLRHETTFTNLTDKPVAPQRVTLALGTAAPTNHDDTGLQLTTGVANGEKQTFVPRGDLESSGGFFGLNAHDARASIATGGPVVWASVTNQFFAAILTPAEPAAGLVTRRVKLFPRLDDTDHNAHGLTGALQVDLKPLAPRATAKFAATLYVGPKEYSRLSNSTVFQADEDKVMQFGFWKYFSQLLLKLMSWMHGLVPNWGVAIILTTLTLKIVTLPLTLTAARSMKRMAKLQPQMVALREKFKDNPQKMQQATMALYKEHKINPLGGCIPMLLPMPFFFGFFTMLQSAAELRFAPFLWSHDLSAADTVAHLAGFPVNIMPVLMGATMIFQMRLTPQPATMDNTQAKMMKFMPYVFALFCYNFSAALSLYSFTNGLFTIAQQLAINRMKDPADPAPAVVTAGGKPVKNVTPKKK